jgi:hypothetical protein
MSWRTRVTRPDGTREERLEVSHGEQVAKSETTAKVDAHERVEYRDREVTKTVETARPSWRVSALGGLGLDLRPVYGAHVERRILGPLSAGRGR